MSDKHREDLYMNRPDFRYATPDDCGLILYFIRELAAYEKMSDEVVATED